jgi:16S rRNA (cytosine967-C5)-methyltransferase
LRETLRTDRRLSPYEKREAALAVFAYFRWFGWMNLRKHLEDQVREAVELAEAFRKDPDFISDEDLLARAVPEWARQTAKLSPALLRQFQSEPALWLRCRRESVEELKSAIPAALPHPALPTAFHYTGEEDLFRSEVFKSGTFEIQDISSQWVGWFTEAKPGETWWDACAGEGGKTLHLSDQMANKGLIWATDPAKWRIDRLKKRAARAKAFNFRSRLWKAGEPLPFKTKFDGILVDAPCSGMGTWQRNPQARWTARPEDVSELAEIQVAILKAAQQLLKPGGRLVYSVCTLAAKETEEVVARFSADHPAFKAAQPALAPETRMPSEGAAKNLGIWLLPQQVNGNGMFCAIWRKET